MIHPATPTYLHAEEAMEEGEVDEASLTGKGRLNEAARAMVRVYTYVLSLPSFTLELCLYLIVKFYE